MTADGLYRGEALRAVAMPLGGLGTGSIALAGDGSLRQWQIHNQVNHMACIPHSFFAIWARPRRPPLGAVARLLQSSALYDHDGETPPPTSNDHVVPLPHRRLLSKLPGVTSTEFTGAYPIAAIKYLDHELRLDISLEAFNPFVPLESKDSAIPAVLFNFTISNPTDQAMLASIAGTLQNAAGWDGVAPIFDTRCSLYGGNTNALIRADERTTIAMSNAWLPDDHERSGTMALAVNARDATYLTQWENLRVLWDDFSADGRLSNVADSSPSAAGRTWNCALAVPMTLEPGESRTISFTIAWHFPNRHVNYSQRDYFELEDDKSKFYLGNRYNVWFDSATDVIGHVSREGDRLTSLTRLARDAFYDTTLPFSLIDAVTSQMSIARTPSCFWVEDGAFYGFEGCNGVSTPHNEPVGGCCPLNCTHVWNYEMALARLFPELERSMRDTEWDIQQHPSGYLPHRVPLPAYLPRIWDRKIGGPANPALDGLLGALLKTYREFLARGDEAWLDHVWPSVKRALEYIWVAHDPERSGVIEGEQPNTYDISIYGVNTFIGTMYLASLRAIEELAKRKDDEENAVECRAAFERGRATHEQRLWNGEYYIQDVDLERYPAQNWGKGCHTDQLFGQWWAHLLGLGHVLDGEHVRTTARSIVRHNFLDSFVDYAPPVQTRQLTRHFANGDDGGLLLCTWPHGGRPDVPTQYSDEVWTGMEYEVAALLLQEGDPDLALKVIAAVRRRYDGRKMNPWNNIECGDHYVRAMSSWSLLEAASGYFYDASAGTIGFAPRIQPDQFRAPFFTRDGWGTVEQQIVEGKLSLHLRPGYGVVKLKELRLQPRAEVRVLALSLNGEVLNGSIHKSTDGVSIHFSDEVIVAAGSQLIAVLS